MKWLIPAPKVIKPIDVKTKIMLRASWVSAVGNVLLSALKLAVGFITGSLAVIGDGIDSATDVLVSVVMVYTAGIVSRPPDSKHVYGYEKAEGIASKILSFVIFYAGMQMLVSSIQSTFASHTRSIPEIWAIYVTVISIFGKLALSFFQFREGKRINSQMLIANAKNMRSDVLISVGVLVGLFFTFVLNKPVLDSITGIIISLFILKTSVSIFLDSNAELMDSVADTAVYDFVFDAVDATEGACNPHRVRIRTKGGMYLISLDIEADGNCSLYEAHKIASQTEENIRQRLENVYDIRIHVEPAGTVHTDEKFGVERKRV
ncbi:MAG: cation diffusion facilitator family transporter [Prevotellaceae bacterium]|jgi:cation diffusion facilitator family transporter|nr:cation diffusion facilitator family transporter [Prevotellaceae bacterium]